MICTEDWQSTSSPPSDAMGVDVLEHGTQHIWTLQSILLCSVAAQFQFSTDTTSRVATDRWLHLWESTRSWFESLPLPVHPIFRAQISAIFPATPSFFPIFLYSSRSSMYSAVLYHTIIALLLQSKPRSVKCQNSDFLTKQTAFCQVSKLRLGMRAGMWYLHREQCLLVI
jgi:hypothetical protein